MKILYVAASPFPDGNAYSTRIYGICKALQSSDNEVLVLTDSISSKMPNNVYEGMRIISGSKHLTIERTRFDNWTSKYSMLYQLKKLIKQEGIDCIISSSMANRYSAITKIARLSHVPIILESCEWFDENNWQSGKNDKGYRRYIKAWESDFPQNDGVIAISKMLAEHYAETSKKVLRLPTIMNVLDIKWNPIPSEDRIRLLFTGSIAWGKDRITEVVEAMDRIGSDKIELHIYGPKKKEIEIQLGDLIKTKAYQNHVIIHERVTHEQLLNEIANYDLGVIIRPDRRQSNAGFPTKLAEYMSCGVPVVANDTGDIGLHLETDKNGYLLPTDTKVEGIIETLKKHLSSSVEQRMAMRHNARMTAEKSFDYRTASNRLNDFVKDIIGKQ